MSTYEKGVIVCIIDDITRRVRVCLYGVIVCIIDDITRLVRMSLHVRKV